MRKIIFVVFISFTLLGCVRDPMDTVLNKDNYTEVVENIRKNADKKTWDAVNGLIQLNAFSNAFSGISTEYGSLPKEWEGKSFNDILKIIKERLDEKKKINEIVNNSIRINGVEVWGDIKNPYNWSIDISFHNISDIRISKFYGTLTLIDNNGKEHSSKSIVYEAHGGALNPGETQEDTYDFVETGDTDIVEILMTGKIKLTIMLTCHELIDVNGKSYIYSDINI
ncbi:hypothetical protein B4O97_03640 [Marispirochaeta aestuarii]|uniref:Uncharacterized protein n=1 Tax=Marispirochaeta aestuarii TaxID=1963862 RepID=A0A1Y1S2Y9_9SPIO|nr:hypothetical protein [Marispirochaeta aestuarii]ORC37294.1 hypothetical protein B4O97_03640 [Marispirochaeta aestuarii]